jgi:hypothetical protein
VLRPSPAIEVEALRDDDRAADREDLARADHAVPGVEPCVVLEDVAGGHAEFMRRKFLAEVDASHVMP